MRNILKALLLFLYILWAVVVVYFLQPPYIVSILFVLAPPSLVNFLWLKKSRFKILIFSFTSAILFAPPIELMSRLVNAWDVASLFPRPFGYIPLENMVFAFFNFFWVLSFYEYFIDRDITKQIAKRFKVLMLFYLFFAALIFSLFFYNQKIVGVNYHIMSAGILFVPSLIIFSRYPKILKKTIFPTLFFAAIFFIYEMVSMSIGHWWWPGRYLHTFNINGMIFPLDDVIAWYLLSTPTLLGSYEVFADDAE